MSFTFKVPGKIVAWKRARTGNGHYFTDPEAKKYQVDIGWYCKKAMSTAGAQKSTTGLVLTAKAYFPMPPSWSARRRQESLGEPHAQKPDIDNVLKQILDALKDIAWVDDKQVAGVTMTKHWTADETGGLIVTVKEWTEFVGSEALQQSRLPLL